MCCDSSFFLCLSLGCIFGNSSIPVFINVFVFWYVSVVSVIGVVSDCSESVLWSSSPFSMSLNSCVSIHAISNFALFRVLFNCFFCSLSHFSYLHLGCHFLCSPLSFILMVAITG